MTLKPVVPFEPITTEQLPEGDHWVAQIKWDGVRMLTYHEGGDTRLINRRLHDRSMQYPEFMSPSSFCAADSFILDGEFIALRDGVPSFYEIMKRDSLRKTTSIAQAVMQTPVTYMIFDILYLNGEWITRKPLLERQRLLEAWIRPDHHIQLVQNTTDMSALYEVMKLHKMEGIVCKDLNSSYGLNGKDKRWQKKKIFHDLVAVVGGVTYRSNQVNALMLGLYDTRGNLQYIGHAGTGKLSQADWRKVTERISPLIIEHKPFANEPQRSKEAIWVKPEIVVKVQFMEWTPYRTMRHPSIQSFVESPITACNFPEN